MKSVIFVLASLLPASAVAADRQSVELVSTVMVEKVAIANGQQTLVLQPPRNVLPNDRLVFDTRYRNVGPKPVQHFVVTNPLPNGVMWSGDSSAGVEVSVDGGRQWGALARLTVADPAGRSRAATTGDVNALRWTIDRIAPGANGTLRYRGIVR